MIAVVLYHAQVTGFSGGYVGVDVFFVISGFLITSILLPEIHAGRLGLAQFYERRIRRILPALFVVMGACVAAAWWLFMPDQLVSLGRSAIRATIFLSNVFFRQQLDDYFAASLGSSPLLHTWSLAIEEQFYVVYPLALYVAFRLFGKRAPVAVLLVAAASFATSVWAVGAHPQGAFYRSSTRAWELLVGALIALDVIQSPARRRLREAAAIIGLALISWTIVTYTSTTPFPGFAALAPCLGTALIIIAGKSGTTTLGHVLGIKPVRWIGLISYSLYLWHWPILVFCRQMLGDLGPMTTVAAIGVSIVAAALSWRFVEMPFRRPHVIGRPAVLAFAVASVMAGLLVGRLAVTGAGFPSRLPSEVARIAAAAADSDPRVAACTDRDPTDVADGSWCRIGASGSVPPSFVLWGDSHAGALFPAVEAAARRHGLSGEFASRLACPPLLDVTIDTSAGGPLCRPFNDTVLTRILAGPSVRTVILIARWAIYAEGTPFGAEHIRPLNLIDDSSGATDRYLIFARSLARTVAAIERSGRQVVVVGPVPEIGRSVPERLAIRQLTGQDRSIAPTRQAFLARQDVVLGTLKRMEADQGVRVVYPDRLLCPGPTCTISDGTQSYYIDDDHLSVHGALAISSLFDPVMDAITSRPVAESRAR